MKASGVWTVTRIREIFASSSPGDWGTDTNPESGIAVLRSTNFRNDGSIDYSDIAYRKVEKMRLANRRVTKGAILIEKSGGSPSQPAGRVAYCDSSFNGTASNFIEIIRVKNNFSSQFVAYLLYYLYQTGLVLKYQQQTTGIINFKLNEYVEEIVKYPSSKPEQTKIAEILSTVDLAIEQTEALIAKQRRIKTGLMQDLLTRGIDEHGNLRSEQTHQFKDSPFGRIPVEWEVGQLGDILDDSPRNGIYKPANQIGTGTLMIGQTSFTGERRIDYSLARRAKISGTELSAYALRDLDLLITRVFATVEGVGLPVLVTDLPEDAVYESNMLRLRIEKKQMHPLLLFYWLRSSEVRKRIVASVNASNQTSVNQKVLKELPILISPDNEQKRIVEIISTKEKHIYETISHNQKLRLLKTALMQGLLTGKMRVTSLLDKQEKAA